MLTVDQRHPDREDSTPPTAEEQRSLNHLADTEIEMETSTKLPLKRPDVLTAENFHTALANVQTGLTNHRHRRRKLPRPDNQTSDR